MPFNVLVQICTKMVDFTDVIVKDVLKSGLCDEEQKMKVLVWHDLYTKTFAEIVQYIGPGDLVLQLNQLKKFY